MIYTIKELENVQTSTGKPMKKLTIESTDGVSKVNIFSDFPHYADLTIGSTIDGELKKNDKGYTNLYSIEIKRGGAFKPNQVAIKEAQDTKRQDISHAQDNKERSIKIASTMRMAVDLAIAEWKDQTQLDTLEQGIKKWRAFCWKEWDKEDKDFDAF